MDHAVMCGDLVFWPVSAMPADVHRKWRIHPGDFWDQHRAALESGILSETVIGEIGKCMLASSETRYLDRFEGRAYMYGSEDASSVPESRDASGWSDQLPFDEDDEAGPYEDRLFWTVGAQDWFDGIAVSEDTPCFGRKLIIIMGRQRAPLPRQRGRSETARALGSRCERCIQLPARRCCRYRVRAPRVSTRALRPNQAAHSPALGGRFPDRGYRREILHRERTY